MAFFDLHTQNINKIFPFPCTHRVRLLYTQFVLNKTLLLRWELWVVSVSWRLSVSIWPVRQCSQYTPHTALTGLSNTAPGDSLRSCPSDLHPALWAPVEVVRCEKIAWVLCRQPWLHDKLWPARSVYSSHRHVGASLSRTATAWTTSRQTCSRTYHQTVRSYCHVLTVTSQSIYLHVQFILESFIQNCVTLKLWA